MLLRTACKQYGIPKCIARTNLPPTGICWPENGLEKTETCSHAKVLMIVCYCWVRRNKAILYWILKTHRDAFY